MAAGSSDPSASTNSTNLDDRPNYRPQFLASFVACLAPLAVGCALGYSSSAVPDINKSASAPFHLDDQESSLVGSIVTVGALFGGMIAGLSVDYFGRKLCMMLVMLPMTFGWLFIISAQNILMMYIGRFLTGLCCGILSLNVPVYISEIALPKYRGLLGGAFQLFVNVGILFAFLIGSFVSWNWLAVICAIYPVMVVIGMIFMPETPTWLLIKKERDEALLSLSWLRGPNADIELECSQLEQNSCNDSQRLNIRDFMKPTLLKPLAIILFEMFFQQMCGVNAVIFNIVSIFRNSSQTMDPNLAAVIVGVVMVISTFFAILLMDKAGRKLLLLLSSIIMAISMTAMGGFYYVKLHLGDSKAEHVSWLPVVCLIVYIFAFMLGYGPIPWLMMSELFPCQARGPASSIATAFNWTMAFLVSKTFVDLKAAMGADGTFWLYAAASYLSIPFVWLFVPETKGKSLEEIQEYFNGGRGLQVLVNQ